MTQATSGTTTVNYKFDAFGNRIGRSQTVSGVTTTEQYVVEGWDTAKPQAIGTENFDTILDLDGSGNVTARREFDPGFDMLGVRVDGAGTAWYLGDRLGSVRQVTNASGAVTGTLVYDAFGNTTSTTGTGQDRYGFTGREWDSKLSLQYSRGRMYNPTAGRWMSEDPIRQSAGDANLYRYVGNGATNGRDPSGLQNPAGSLRATPLTPEQQFRIWLEESYPTTPRAWLPPRAKPEKRSAKEVLAAIEHAQRAILAATLEQLYRLDRAEALLRQDILDRSDPGNVAKKCDELSNDIMLAKMRVKQKAIEALLALEKRFLEVVAHLILIAVVTEFSL
jgi:RHS repeat-associated protein